MTLLITDLSLEERLNAERQASGADRFDEVWDGVYVMPPMPNVEHQQLASRIGGVLFNVIDCPGLGDIHVGVNVSDREDGWEHNYRVPDVAVFLSGTKARNCGAHWCGGPDFVVEITSLNDQTRDKLSFYGRIGVRELLLIDRDPWALELYRLQGVQMGLVDRGDATEGQFLASAVLPLAFRLVHGTARPHVEVMHRDGEQRWLI